MRFFIILDMFDNIWRGLRGWKMFGKLWIGLERFGKILIGLVGFLQGLDIF